MRGPAVDWAVQRRNMVDSDVRASDVTDDRILRALLDTPRERFLPPCLHGVAYTGGCLPLTPRDATRQGRRLMAPRTFGKLVQLAEIGAAGRVLDVGCATGYSAAVLSRLAATVVALEADSALASAASTELAALGYDNVGVVKGELSEGLPSEGPYDAIVVEGHVPCIPPALLDQLGPGGRLVAILTVDGVGRACLWRRFGATFARSTSFDATAPELPGFGIAQAFVF